MEPPDEVTLWKAPQKGRNAVSEVLTGFDAGDYGGNGPYFALDRELAEDWQRVYENGLQVLRLPRALFDEFVRQGMIQADSYYPGRSCHVLPSGLAAFNDAIRQGTPNSYFPQETGGA